MDRLASAAHRKSRRNAESLRSIPSAPGLAAWGGLPERDRALLRWLLVGDVVTSELAAVLAYGSLRTARRRLARLVELGLVRGFWAANSQRPRGRYAYELVRSVREELEPVRVPIRRRGGRERAPKTTIHQLATSDLMASFLRAADPSRSLGLCAWLPERAIAALFDGYVRPDALAVIGTPSSRVCLFVERDLGTEGSRVVAAKATRYAALLAGRSVPPVNLGIVVESSRRVGSIRRAVEAAAPGDLDLWFITSAELVASPYEAEWTALDGRLRRTVDLPAEAAEAEPVIGALCLVELDGVDAFEPSAIEPVSALRRFARVE